MVFRSPAAGMPCDAAFIIQVLGGLKTRGQMVVLHDPKRLNAGVST